jgi:hypothetical protein
LDDAIDDIEQGRVQSIDEAWKEIDSSQSFIAMFAILW